MLRDSTVAIAIVRKRPQAIPLPMITMRKSIHEFLFPYVVMGLCLAVRATRAPLLLITSNSSHYICPRVGYDVFYAMNCTILISKYVYFFCLQAIELK